MYPKYRCKNCHEEFSDVLHLDHQTSDTIKTKNFTIELINDFTVFIGLNGPLPNLAVLTHLPHNCSLNDSGIAELVGFTTKKPTMTDYARVE